MTQNNFLLPIYHWSTLSSPHQDALLQRPKLESANGILTLVANTIAHVQCHGDLALHELTKLYDNVELQDLQVTANEFAMAEKLINTEIKDAIEFAARQIDVVHRAQLPKFDKVAPLPGIMCQREARPIQSVGLYVPGGNTPLVSSLLMLAIPARLANCPTRVICTPPRADGSVHPALLVAAKMAGIAQVFKVGGAQAIAAMAYGTETIPKVAKIFGPGNRFVTQAKLLVSQDPNGAGIDLPAGPSELLILADHTANPDFVAADLLSQAEHGVDSQVILVTTSESIATQVQQAIMTAAGELPRHAILKQSLNKGAIIITDSLQDAIQLANRYAPEHLSIQTEHPDAVCANIMAAGAIFIGPYTPESAGDYLTGSNHVLPTYGYARVHSGLSLHDFMIFMNVQTVNREGLAAIQRAGQQLAELENLSAHAKAFAVRFEVTV